MNSFETVSVSDAPTAEWQQLLPELPQALYASPGWQRVVSELGPAVDVAVGRRQGRINAVVPMVALAQRPGNALLDPAAIAGVGDGDGDAWQPLLFLGSFTGYTTEPLGSWSDWTNAIRYAVAQHPEAAVIAVPYVRTEVAERLVAEFDGACALVSSARSTITVATDTFDGHLATLRGSQRNQLRGDRRKFAAGSRKLITEPLLATDLDRLGVTVGQMMRKHGAATSPDAGNIYVNALAESPLAEDGVVFSCWGGDEAIAHSLCFRWGDSLVLRVVGLDYERTGEHAEYGHVLVHGPVEYAMAHGLRTVELGVAMERAKVGRGAGLTANWTVLLRAPRGAGKATASANAVAAAAYLANYPRSFTESDLRRLASAAATTGGSDA